eukprot:9557688-Prorocentrum_lima.AAC.1
MKICAKDLATLDNVMTHGGKAVTDRGGGSQVGWLPYLSLTAKPNHHQHQPKEDEVIQPPPSSEKAHGL